MPTAFDVRALTSTVRIELDDTLTPDDQEFIRAQWNDLIVEAPDAPLMTIRATLDQSVRWVKSPDEFDLPGRSVEEIADEIASQVTLAAIRGLRGSALLLHAAAVALDDGRVIGFVGPSGRGKTTASHALSSAYRYVTDETLAVQPDGTVIAFPKPLSIGAHPARKEHKSASGLGLRPASGDGLWLAALVLLDRRPGIDQPYVETVSLTDALAELVPQSSYLSKIDNPLRTLAQSVISTGGVRRVVYSEAETLPPLVDEILDTIDEAVPSLTDVAAPFDRDCDCAAKVTPGGSVAVDTLREDAPPGTYRRANAIDALLVDDGLLVLSQNEVTFLEGLGPIVWLAADDSTEDDLRDAALQQLPDPPEGVDPSEVVAAAIHELVGARLLARN